MLKNLTPDIHPLLRSFSPSHTNISIQAQINKQLFIKDKFPLEEAIVWRGFACKKKNSTFIDQPPQLECTTLSREDYNSNGCFEMFISKWNLSFLFTACENALAIGF